MIEIGFVLYMYKKKMINYYPLCLMFSPEVLDENLT